MRAITAALTATLALSVVARADVVHLRNGRTIQGKIVDTRRDRIVVQTSNGRVEVPLKQVARVERESRGRLLLDQARQAERDGDPELAVKLYRGALEHGEAEAGEALARLAPERAAGAADAPDDPAERLTAAARALAMGDGARARALAEPLRAHEAIRQRASYVLGRALELLGEPDLAERTYRDALAELEVSHGVEVLRELARLRYTGVRLSPSVPGVGPGWSVALDDRWMILARPARVDHLRRDADLALREITARLELPELRRRVTVFDHDDRAAYRESEGATWAIGHAARRRATGEVAPVVHLSSGEEPDVLRHELAHVLVLDAFAGHDLPRWLLEGSAVFCETADWRARRRKRARELLAGAPLGDLLAIRHAPWPTRASSPEEAGDAYARAALLFEALARCLGGARRAVECALDLQAVDDVRRVLQRHGSTLESLREAVVALMREVDAAERR